jgi:hypothetical protein
MDEHVGTEISGFRIEAEIGRGGMGEVYLATWSFPERMTVSRWELPMVTCKISACDVCARARSAISPKEERR